MPSLKNSLNDYHKLIQEVWNNLHLENIGCLENDLFDAWKKRNKVFLCGNGGSAANANHLANDLLYGICPDGEGIMVNSLSSNASVSTCLANDIGFDHIFSKQLSILGSKNDLLLVMSGSGNSENIIEALLQAKKMGIKTHAMLGFNGGKSKEIADNGIHFEVQDMQISEDMQMIIGHILMKRLRDRK